MPSTLVDFQTAYKMMSQPGVFAWHQDQENPSFYYGDKQTWVVGACCLKTRSFFAFFEQLSSASSSDEYESEKVKKVLKRFRDKKCLTKN